MKRTKALILLAHGSRARQTLEEMRLLTAKLQQLRRTSAQGLIVKGAFLSLQKPDLAMALQLAVEAGAQEIHVLPLFLFTGKHVLEDIPALFDALKINHPKLKLALLDPIGAHADFAEFLLRTGGFA